MQSIAALIDRWKGSLAMGNGERAGDHHQPAAD
jgi:hypothetical protein